MCLGLFVCPTCCILKQDSLVALLSQIQAMPFQVEHACNVVLPQSKVSLYKSLHQSESMTVSAMLAFHEVLSEVRDVLGTLNSSSARGTLDGRHIFVTVFIILLTLPIMMTMVVIINI